MKRNARFEEPWENSIESPDWLFAPGTDKRGRETASFRYGDKPSK
jgi:hypothetical protein